MSLIEPTQEVTQYVKIITIYTIDNIKKLHNVSILDLNTLQYDDNLIICNYFHLINNLTKLSFNVNVLIGCISIFIVSAETICYVRCIFSALTVNIGTYPLFRRNVKL